MRVYFIILLFSLIICQAVSVKYEDISDNEFAEFEDFESDDDIILNNDFKDTNEKLQSTGNNNNNNNNNDEDDDIVIDDDDIDVVGDDDDDDDDDDDEDEDDVDDDDTEFEHFQDFDEFEGYEQTKEKPLTEPKITITKVPLHFRANWDSYWLEILMVIGLIIYFINFLIGKSKNTKIANVWFQVHKNLLEDNFCLVGDNNEIEPESTNGFYKESENVFSLWCSGRLCCEGMLVELKLIKRQDLCAIIGTMMRPTLDQINIKVIMNKEDMDSFIFAVASKRYATHFAKEMADLSIYCPERRPGEKFNLPANYQVMSEIHEATSAILDTKVTTILTKYQEIIEFIHFSDQYSGVKQSEDNATTTTTQTQTTLKLPDNQKVLLFCFNIPLKGLHLEDAMNQIKPLLMFVFYCIDKVKRYRLSKEAKQKADKNRQKVEEAFLKSTHHARAEAAAARREEKRRLEKEKIMADEDPERQRRWEEKEQKRQAKKRAPKMRQLKVKAL